jgi:1-phosphatidylinositol phosphodiesterase
VRVALALALVACGSDPQGEPDWMATIADTRSLAELSMPGTHDSGALFEPYMGLAKCQNLSIADQLAAGVRYFDIRCRNFNDQFLIYHGSVDQNQTYDEVLAAMFAFLDAHPTETIVISVQEELAAQGATLTFEQLFAQYVAQAPSRWYLGTTVPHLGEARGKLVLLRRFVATTIGGIDADPVLWLDNASFSIITADATLHIEDAYMVTDNDAKWSAITSNVGIAATDPAGLYLTYTSGYQLINGLPSIPTVASDINARLDTWLAPGGVMHTGVVVSDFITAPRAAAIIATNAP